MQPKIFFALPYDSGSHKYWADNIIKFGSFDYHLETMSGRHWKWRMQGASIHLAEMFKNLNEKIDLVLCSTMMDVSLFKSITNCQVPIIYYMHENQLSYPFSDAEKRSQENFHYGFINYKSCLAADLVLFNSDYHRNDFLSALKRLLARLPDYINPMVQSTEIYSKSKINWVGIDFSFLNKVEPNKHSGIPTLLWNHRWEHDKNPTLFMKLCDYLAANDHQFQLILLGQDGNASEVKELINQKYGSQVLHTGYAKSKENYHSLIRSANLLPVTSDHDYYGLSVLEAIAANVTPLLPHNKVYEEFLDKSEYPLLFYNSSQELFDKTVYNLNKQPEPLNIDFLEAHNCIHTIRTLESYMEALIS